MNAAQVEALSSLKEEDLHTLLRRRYALSCEVQALDRTIALLRTLFPNVKPIQPEPEGEVASINIQPLTLPESAPPIVVPESTSTESMPKKEASEATVIFHRRIIVARFIRDHGPAKRTVLIREKAVHAECFMKVVRHCDWFEQKDGWKFSLTPKGLGELEKYLASKEAKTNGHTTVPNGRDQRDAGGRPAAAQVGLPNS